MITGRPQGNKRVLEIKKEAPERTLCRIRFGKKLWTCRKTDCGMMMMMITTTAAAAVVATTLMV